MKYLYEKGVVEEVIRRKQHKCPLCGSTRVSAYRRGTRIVTGLPCGSKTFWLRFDVHTITCSIRDRQAHEPFLPRIPSLRLTSQRGLQKLANGYRNDEFFKLKIYDLPD